MYISSKAYPIDIKAQSVEIPESDGVRQSKLTPIGVTLDYMFSDAKTVAEVLQRGHRISDNGPCLGWRDSESDYKWFSYGEVIEKAKSISAGLMHSGMERGQGSFVAIYAQNCVEWVLVEHACYNQSVVTVPLYESLGPENITFILNHVEAEIVVCDTETKVRYLLDAVDELPRLKQVIAIQDISKEIKEVASERKIVLQQLKDVADLGRRNPTSLMLPCPSDLATICYTSGTTGDPKGVMVTHANMVADASAFIKHLGSEHIGVGDRHMSYLPLAHMLERISHVIYFSTGASVGFFRGDINFLGVDIRALKPTMLAAVPRVLNKIYDKVQSEVKNSKIKKILLNAALRAKQAELERGILRNNSIWDQLVLKNIRNALGGKVRLLLTGGAPIRDEVLLFFRCCLGCPVVQAYGQTETSAAVTTSVIGTVGPPVPCCFVKLIDVPEMNYYACQNEGEILVKGSNVTKGYFKDPVKTAEAIDENGWLHTGDIGRWLENGSLAIIDRKKNLLKLSQGEFVSPEKLETVYMASIFVEQMYLHGDSLESCLVAIVVPEKETLLSWCSQKGIKAEWNDICQNENVKKYILNQLHQLGKEAGLRSFEQVKAIYLHPDAFSLQNGILTATMKVKREECKRRFRDVIDKMYEGMQ